MITFGAPYLEQTFRMTEGIANDFVGLKVSDLFTSKLIRVFDQVSKFKPFVIVAEIEAI